MNPTYTKVFGRGGDLPNDSSTYRQFRFYLVTVHSSCAELHGSSGPPATTSHHVLAHLCPEESKPRRPISNLLLGQWNWQFRRVLH
ncbi:hypothetical protein J6590_038014 [Homalodisca vitripennis]|nr:hypothetical protein J6590_038014 [Homalodisca vitripennis]